jgi:purine-nucleoside phosphorylase
MLSTTGLSGLLDQAVATVRQARAAQPALGVVLGSGLGAFADTLGALVKVPYADIPKMPVSRVAGHAGNLCLGTVEGVEVACMQGRVHLYEGHEPERVVFGVRLLARLGCKAVLLTNAAGGIHPCLRPGDLMLIVDHINLTGRNPLLGPNPDALGDRFPDMSEAYDRGLAGLARRAALEVGVALKEGVYLANLGPAYETPAEVRMARALGADAVGMSTVPEVIALRHMRVRTAAVSCITNLAAGISPTPLCHAEVEQTATRTREQFVRLLTRWVELTGAEGGA